MNTKFNIGDPVIYRENGSFSEDFNFDIEPLHIVVGFTESFFKTDLQRRDNLLKQGYDYVIRNIKEDCGWGHLGFLDYAKESELKLYTENDPDVLSFYYDAKEELESKSKL